MINHQDFMSVEKYNQTKVIRVTNHFKKLIQNHLLLNCVQLKFTRFLTGRKCLRLCTGFGSNIIHRTVLVIYVEERY